MKMQCGETIVDLDEKWTVWEEIALEDEMKMTMQQLAEFGAKGSGRAMLALVWLQRRRTEPKLKPSGVDFSRQDVVYLSGDGQVLTPKIERGQSVIRNGASVMLLPDGTEYVEAAPPKD